MSSGLTLNKDKCEFSVKELKFLGHILSSEGIRVDPEKERAIKEMPAPQDLKGLKRFLAIVNYLGKFSPLLSKLEIPLRELVRAKNDWCWTYRQQESFDKVREAIEERNRCICESQTGNIQPVLLPLRKKN